MENLVLKSEHGLLNACYFTAPSMLEHLVSKPSGRSDLIVY
jgi:hypothetical protein